MICWPHANAHAALAIWRKPGDPTNRCADCNKLLAAPDLEPELLAGWALMLRAAILRRRNLTEDDRTRAELDWAEGALADVVSYLEEAARLEAAHEREVAA